MAGGLPSARLTVAVAERTMPEWRLPDFRELLEMVVSVVHIADICASRSLMLCGNKKQGSDLWGAARCTGAGRAHAAVAAAEVAACRTGKKSRPFSPPSPFESPRDPWHAAMQPALE